jgi:hypothetical protein
VLRIAKHMFYPFMTGARRNALKDLLVYLREVCVFRSQSALLSIKLHQEIFHAVLPTGDVFSHIDNQTRFYAPNGVFGGKWLLWLGKSISMFIM